MPVNQRTPGNPARLPGDHSRSKAVSELHRIVQNRKIPNALLFSGNPGSGKQEAAFGFAQGANCRQGMGTPCLTCISCKKIAGRMHPDMVVIGLADKKKSISISQIREMEMLISTKPNEARLRMVLITDADRMNVQAQNGLLKVLEEPPDNTFFILTASGTSTLLDTILSRCRLVRFKPLAGRALADHLVEEFSADPESARIAAETAGADLEKAMMFLDLPDGGNWQAKRKKIIGQIIQLITGNGSEKVEKALFLSRELSLDSETATDGLAVLRTFFRDLCIFSYCPDKIVNLDFFDAFQDINQMVNSKKCHRWITDLYETEKRLASNSSVRLAMDRFLLGLVI